MFNDIYTLLAQIKYTKHTINTSEGFRGFGKITGKYFFIKLNKESESLSYLKDNYEVDFYTGEALYLNSRECQTRITTTFSPSNR